VFQLLAVTGQRLNDIAECSWNEIDLDKKLLTIPAERFKSDLDHVVPLSDTAVAILKTLPRFNSGDYVFSTTFGQTPINGFSKPKSRLDTAMKEQIGKFQPFQIHDIRRTMRSALSDLPIEDRVRELVIGHTQQGLHKVYDQHTYLSEKRGALSAWARRLLLILDAPLLSAVDHHLNTNDEAESEECRQDYRRAIMRGGDAWATWLDRLHTLPPGNVVRLTKK
jgi:integrase